MRFGEPSYDPLDVLRLTLMFLKKGNGREITMISDREKWAKLAGTYETTEKVLADLVSNALTFAERRRVSGPKDKGKAIASFVRNAVTNAQPTPLAELIAFVEQTVELYVHEAFDLGVKAAGGSITDDLGRGLVEVAFSIEEIAAIGCAVDTMRASPERIDSNSAERMMKALASAWAKLNFHRRRRT